MEVAARPRAEYASRSCELHPGDREKLKDLDGWFSGGVEVGVVIEQLGDIIDRVGFEDGESTDVRPGGITGRSCGSDSADTAEWGAHVGH